MYSVYFRSSEAYDLIPHRLAWQYWAINPERRGMMLALNGADEFVYVTQLRPGEDPAALSDADTKAFLHGAMGCAFELDIIARSPWTAGLTLVAERFQAHRVFLGGDAVHLFTPTGGLGYNTAVDDAVNLGWKLAAKVKGWGGEGLLGSFEREREPVARRNTAYARTFAQSIGGMKVPADLEEESEAGGNARTTMGQYLNAHARAEFNIPGITLGARYDESSLIVPDGTHPPLDSPSTYHPTACPGGRAPHAWLSDERSLYDALGFDFTLLKLGRGQSSADVIADAAQSRALPFTVVDVADERLRDLYEADLALIRPDQIVCWRGNRLPADVNDLLDQVTGA